MTTVYDFQAEGIDGQPVALRSFAGQVLLIVNTASQCGFTPQFEALEALYARYKDQGFTVLGFPCNQFGSQDPGSNAEILAFCTRNYGVSFPMMGKVEVNGPSALPLYAWLRREKPGLMGSTAIKWNFTKFLIGRDGHVIRRYASLDKPKSMVGDIENALS